MFLHLGHQPDKDPYFLNLLFPPRRLAQGIWERGQASSNRIRHSHSLCQGIKGKNHVGLSVLLPQFVFQQTTSQKRISLPFVRSFVRRDDSFLFLMRCPKMRSRHSPHSSPGGVLPHHLRCPVRAWTLMGDLPAMGDVKATLLGQTGRKYSKRLADIHRTFFLQPRPVGDTSSPCGNHMSGALWPRSYKVSGAPTTPKR